MVSKEIIGLILLEMINYCKLKKSAKHVPNINSF